LPGFWEFILAAWLLGISVFGAIWGLDSISLVHDPSSDLHGEYVVPEHIAGRLHVDGVLDISAGRTVDGGLDGVDERAIYRLAVFVEELHLDGRRREDVLGAIATTHRVGDVEDHLPDVADRVLVRQPGGKSGCIGLRGCGAGDERDRLISSARCRTACGCGGFRRLRVRLCMRCAGTRKKSEEEYEAKERGPETRGEAHGCGS
jgi:hypothetical protein